MPSTGTTAGRKLLDKTLGVHADAPVPKYHSDAPYRKRARRKPRHAATMPGRRERNTRQGGAVRHLLRQPQRAAICAEDLTAVFEHNGIPVTSSRTESCCGMPKLELGDLEAVAKLQGHQHPAAARSSSTTGYDIVAPIPSCVLMFKQELPLMFPDDARRARCVERACSIRSNT